MESPSEPNTGEFVRASDLYTPAEGHTLTHVRLRADYAAATEVRR